MPFRCACLVLAYVLLPWAAAGDTYHLVERVDGANRQSSGLYSLRLDSALTFGVESAAFARSGGLQMAAAASDWAAPGGNNRMTLSHLAFAPAFRKQMFGLSTAGRYSPPVFATERRGNQAAAEDRPVVAAARRLMFPAEARGAPAPLAIGGENPLYWFSILAGSEMFFTSGNRLVARHGATEYLPPSGTAPYMHGLSNVGEAAGTSAVEPDDLSYFVVAAAAVRNPPPGSWPDPRSPGWQSAGFARAARSGLRGPVVPGTGGRLASGLAPRGPPRTKRFPV